MAGPEETMLRLITRLRSWGRDESGQDLIEYGLVAALISVALIGALTDVGIQANALWQIVSDGITNAMS